MCAEAQTFTIMLPSEITSIITNELKTYKDMASFLSVSKHYLELRNHVLWDKEAIKPNKIFDLPYYDQFVSIILSNKYCRYIPKNIKKISVKESLWSSFSGTCDNIEYFLKTFPKYIERNIYVVNLSGSHSVSPQFW